MTLRKIKLIVLIFIVSLIILDLSGILNLNKNEMRIVMVIFLIIFIHNNFKTIFKTK